MKTIAVNDLQKTYYSGQGVETRALKSATFEIWPGEFVAIMGPSGSGKSTLLQMLGFLDEPTGGSYFFDGKAAGEYDEPSRAKLRNEKMGFVFQSFNLLARTSVLDNVMLPLMYSDVPESEWDNRAKEAILSVGLSHRLEHEPSQLSGGEKQRVAIARALVNKPQIIFADEPTGNLDSKSGQQVMEVLEKLNKEFGHTIILITHETSTAEHAERILRMHDGEVVSDEQVNNRKSANEPYVK